MNNECLNYDTEQRVIDFHCHFDFDEQNYDLLKTCIEKAEITFINCALTEKSYSFSSQITNKNFFDCLGQHPLFQDNSVSLEKTASLLNDNLLFGIGEIGLDKRNPDYEKQRKTFIDFLDLAKQFDKPVFIHCLGYYYEINKILKDNFKDLKVFMHSFTGSIDIIKAYKKNHNYMFYSLNPVITKIKKSQEILKHILSNTNFVFETDNVYSNLNIEIQSPIDLINDIAIVCVIDPNILIKKQWSVFKDLLS